MGNHRATGGVPRCNCRALACVIAHDRKRLDDGGTLPFRCFPLILVFAILVWGPGHSAFEALPYLSGNAVITT